MPKVIKKQAMIDKVKKNFSKKPLVKVEKHYLAITRFIGKYKLHKHNRDELFYVLDGHLEIMVGHKVYHLDEGDIILIKKGEKHQSLNEEVAHILVFEPQDTTIEYLDQWDHGAERP